MDSCSSSPESVAYRLMLTMMLTMMMLHEVMSSDSELGSNEAKEQSMLQSKFHFKTAAAASQHGDATADVQGEPWNSCSWNGCDINTCEDDNGEMWIRRKSKACKKFGITYAHNEYCCPMHVARIDAAFGDSCKWNGCNLNPCTDTQVESMTSTCPRIRHTGLLNTGNNELCCTPKDNSDWLGKLMDEYPSGNPRFDSLSLLGTHHSPATGGLCNDDLSGDCQRLSVADQLRAGVRLFDLRAEYIDVLGDFFHYHNICKYGTIADQFKQINEFLEAHPREIVVILFQHFKNMVLEPTITKFQTILQENLGDKIYKVNKTETKWPRIRDMIEKNHRVIIVSKTRKMFQTDVSHYWSGSGRFIEDIDNLIDYDFIGRYPNSNDVQEIQDVSAREVAAMRNVRVKAEAENAQRKPPMMLLSFFLTDTNIFNPIKHQVRRINPYSYVVSEYLNKTTVNGIFVDYAFTHGGHEMFLRQLEYNSFQFNYQYENATIANFKTEYGYDIGNFYDNVDAGTLRIASATASLTVCNKLIVIVSMISFAAVVN